jgi:hypothetical protein
MFTRRRLSLAITLAACLLVASGASAEPLGSAALTVSITTNPADPSNDASPSFTFKANVVNASFQCKLDGGDFAGCTSPHDYPPQADGPHNFVVKATHGDDVGEASYGWTIDTQQPVTLTATPTNPSNDMTPRFEFTAPDSTKIECRLDDGAPAACTSPKEYTTLPNGRHTFSVSATDALGNVGEASYGWTIDTTPPTVTITVKPPTPSNDASPSFGFTVTDATNIECRLDASAFTPCTSPTQYPDLPDGTHAFSVRAIDAAGNVAEASHTWTIETGAPTAALTSAPPGLSSISAATFGFTADEPSSFECTLDGGGFGQCSSPATYHGLGPPVSHSWTIDTTAPETTLTAAPKAVTTAASATFTFSASEAGSFECRLDGAPFALCGSPKSYAGLGKGDHRFEVRAIDAAGNADATPALHGWKIETAARRISSSALLAPRGGARVTKPPLLRWRPVARARYYNVQVFRGKQKVLSVWPTRARLQLRARWKFAGRVRRLTPGAYRWYVWPGFGVPSARNYGQLLGQSTFVVVRR